MDTYQSISRELFVYGTKNIPYACNKQRPTTHSKVFVQTISGNDVVNEPRSSYAQAVAFVSNMLKNYSTSAHIMRANRCRTGVLYYQTIIDRITRKELFSVKICEQL